MKLRLDASEERGRANGREREAPSESISFMNDMRNRGEPGRNDKSYSQLYSEKR